MKQLSLPALDLPDRVIEDAWPQSVVDEPASATAPDGQLALFSPITDVVSRLYRAVEAGAFEEACRLRLVLAELDARASEVSDLACLERLAAPLFWSRRTSAVLATWRDLERTWSSGPRRAIRAGIVRRLARDIGFRALAEHDPRSLPDIFNVMWAESGRGEDYVRHEARALVRDALLAGRALAPSAFEDEEVTDLLAEDYGPIWLASLGALRHVWPVPSLRAEDRSAVAALVDLPELDEERALQFWHCLRVHACRDAEDALRGHARRHMKRLHARLHALCLKGIPPAVV